MTRPRTRLRTRLLVAMAAIAVGVLVLTGFTTIGLARRNSVDHARQELEGKAPRVATQLENLGRVLLRRRADGQRGGGVGLLLSNVLRISGGGLVTVRPDGSVTEGIVGLADSAPASATRADLQLPPGVSREDLDPEALLAGREQTGRRDGIVFVAQPLTARRNGTPVLVLTQEIEASATNQVRGFFLIGGALAIGVAMIVAFFLARRLTRPLATMGDTARSIAAGDLTARVDLGRHPDDELADLARTLNGMATQLEHARGLERAFILSVSHDLRTPLTSIKGYADALTDGTIAATAEQRRAADVIGAEARRLERLVADLLDLARLDARQFSLTARPIDAAAVIRTAVDAFGPAATDLGITLHVEAPSALPADADPERLAQIVANLLENSLKYATSAITVQVAASGRDQLALRVRDDGPGIDPADVARVFDRLYTSRAAPGRSVGTGLGLAIVRELANAMGGQARIEPTDGAGAAFVVLLPILRPVRAPAT